MYVYIRESYGVCLRSDAFRSSQIRVGVSGLRYAVLVYWVSMLMLVLRSCLNILALLHYFEDAVAIAFVVVVLLVVVLIMLLFVAVAFAVLHIRVIIIKSAPDRHSACADEYMLVARANQTKH